MPGRGQKDLFERLIREVKVRECLYNIRHPGYKDRHNTEGQWSAVASAVGMTVMEVKRLWGTLRSSYTRSVKGSLTAASGSSAQKKTPWYLEDEMTFLRPHLQLCMPGGNMMASNASFSSSSSHSHSSSFGQEPRDLDINQIKMEDITGELMGRRELEEGEILPEDLAAGAYMITPQFPEKRPRLECGSEMGDSVLKDGFFRKDDPETEFFMGIMPRYKELNKKNRRKFEVQALHLLYSILDEQEDKG
ncbi:uncharacterized protein LOC101852207 [Aplysia californica]|uniref:Uncharacterized protein LOC101852207 n=1 Tax=Aplysia californica TaxID=6500 RepID=A0ABM0K3L4_APLCA|nr:uncharacterized protein LOC101852207 [Aplysia californica]